MEVVGYDWIYRMNNGEINKILNSDNSTKIKHNKENEA